MDRGTVTVKDVNPGCGAIGSNIDTVEIGVTDGSQDKGIESDIDPVAG